MLDTNICIELIRGRAAHVFFARLRQNQVDQVAISSITLAELEYGVANSARPAHNAALPGPILRPPLAILPFDNPAAQAYGSGTRSPPPPSATIGPLDTLIATRPLR